MSSHTHHARPFRPSPLCAHPCAKRYWLRAANRFDLVVSVLLALTTLLWLAGEASPYPVPAEALRYLNLLRLLQAP